MTESETLDALGLGMKRVKKLISTIAELSKMGVSTQTLSKIPKIRARNTMAALK